MKNGREIANFFSRAMRSVTISQYVVTSHYVGWSCPLKDDERYCFTMFHYLIGYVKAAIAKKNRVNRVNVGLEFHRARSTG